MSKSQRFKSRVVNHYGLETSTYVDEWGAKVARIERVSESVGLRVMSGLIVSPDDYTVSNPRSSLQRRMDSLNRGIDIELDPDTIETRGGAFFNPIHFDDYKRRSRSIIALSAYGVVPELDGQNVAVEAHSVMLHSATMRELQHGTFINIARITPYVTARPDLKLL